MKKAGANFGKRVTLRTNKKSNEIPESFAEANLGKIEEALRRAIEKNDRKLKNGKKIWLA